jgi:hypothetical protein
MKIRHLIRWTWRISGITLIRYLPGTMRGVNSSAPEGYPVHAQLATPVVIHINSTAIRFPLLSGYIPLLCTMYIQCTSVNSATFVCQSLTMSYIFFGIVVSFVLWFEVRGSCSTSDTCRNTYQQHSDQIALIKRVYSHHFLLFGPKRKQTTVKSRECTVEFTPHSLWRLWTLTLNAVLLICITTGVASWAWTGYPSGALEFTPRIVLGFVLFYLVFRTEYLWIVFVHVCFPFHHYFVF